MNSHKLPLLALACALPLAACAAGSGRPCGMRDSISRSPRLSGDALAGCGAVEPTALEAGDGGAETAAGLDVV